MCRRRGRFRLFLTYGFFFMSSYPMVEAALMQSVPDAVRGRVFGLFITVGGLIGNLSHWIVGEAVRRMGDAAHEPASYFTLYGILAGMILLSLLGLPCLHAIRKREHLERRQSCHAAQMNLPNYFLADLPPEATLTPHDARRGVRDVEAQSRAISRRADDGPNREDHQRRVAEGWLTAENPFRQLALAHGPAPDRALAGRRWQRGLDQFFRQLTRDNLRALLVQELGDARRLDELVADAGRRKSVPRGHRHRAGVSRAHRRRQHSESGADEHGAGLADALGAVCEVRARHVAAAATVRALAFTRPTPSSARVSKSPSGAAATRRWKTALFAEADCVTATGSDETLAAIRAKLPAQDALSRLRPSREFRLCGGREFVWLARARQIVAARRPTWSRGINWAVSRRT